MRAIWKGNISFALVSIPISLFSATRKNEISFHYLHKKDMSSVSYKRFCDVENVEVPWEEITRGGRRPTTAELEGAIEHGAVNRLRPKLMTVAAIMLGLLPALWSHGTGAEVMQRIAAPMVGGMVTSTLLTLLVIPALYFIWRSRYTTEEHDRLSFSPRHE